MQIDAVFFDIYGTLARFDPPREDIQVEAAAQHGIQATPEAIIAGYRDADRTLTEQNSARPLRLMSREEQAAFFARYEQQILAGAGFDVSLDTAGEIWRAIRARPYGMTLFGDVVPTLDRLRADGRVVGAVSNLSQTGFQVQRDLHLEGHIDFVITSGEIGAEKPDPRMFQAALQRAGAEPDRVVHVGDQPSSDILGARQIGLHPVLIDRDRHYEDFTDAPRISQLSEVIPLLAQMESAS